MRELDDKKVICEKSEIAYQTQEKLLSAKDEIIGNLKEILSEREKVTMLTKTNTTETAHAKENIVTSNVNPHDEDRVEAAIASTHTPTAVVGDENPDPKQTIPGLDETILRLQNIALHGVVLDGMLTWVDTQRRTLPADIWKNAALKYFTAEEITNTKNILWDVAKDAILGRNIGRKGDSKSASEMNDICEALKIMSEKQVMPIFMSTSTMMLQSPQNEIAGDQTLCAMGIKLDTIGESLENFSKKLSEQSNKNHDRIISKSEVTNKKMDSLTQKLDFVEDSLRGNELQGCP